MQCRLLRVPEWLGNYLDGQCWVESRVLFSWFTASSAPPQSSTTRGPTEVSGCVSHSGFCWQSWLNLRKGSWLKVAERAAFPGKAGCNSAFLFPFILLFYTRNISSNSSDCVFLSSWLWASNRDKNWIFGAVSQRLIYSKHWLRLEERVQWSWLHAPPTGVWEMYSLLVHPGVTSPLLGGDCLLSLSFMISVRSSSSEAEMKEEPVTFVSVPSHFTGSPRKGDRLVVLESCRGGCPCLFVLWLPDLSCSFPYRKLASQENKCKYQT